MSLSNLDNSTMSPEIFLMRGIKLNNINFASFFQKLLKMIILLSKIQIGLI